MPAGRPRKPTKLHVLHGNPGKRPLNNDPEPEVKIPEPPEIVKGDAREEWNRICAELLALGLVSNLDRTALTLYCKAWARWKKAETELETQAEVVKAPSGYPIRNPWLDIANKEFDKLCRILTEFGMTAAARSRIHASKMRDEKLQGARRFLA